MTAAEGEFAVHRRHRLQFAVYFVFSQLLAARVNQS